MDVIVRYENNEKTNRILPQVGAFVNDRFIAPIKTKAITELHFLDITKEEAAAVKAAYGSLPEALAVQVVTPAAVKPAEPVKPVEPVVPEVPPIAPPAK